MVVGEGAGALVLESITSAQSRGATIYGEVVGHGSSTVLDRNCVAKLDEALANAMRQALRTAEMAPGEIGHVHAHGLATHHSDVQESKAINALFGDRADAIPVTAAKSYFGNLGAGGGVVELIASLLALHHDQLFPVLNYETPDPDCALNVVHDEGTRSGDSFINCNVTPQGQASAIIVRKV
jgi:3-oxoacyl-[acyl-carrier-protein] synthase II